MKKRIIGTIMVAGILLLVSCGSDDGVGPVKATENGTTLTPIVMPTCTPAATPTPDSSKLPTVTETVEPTVELTATPIVAAEPTFEPTAEPETTMEPTPTAEPTVTEVSEPTMIPQETVTPVPAMEQNLLVNNGWQKTISIDEKYSIIFPERFRESEAAKNGSELIINYTCAEDSAIGFRISYTMQQAVEDAFYDILNAEGNLLEGSLEEKRVVLKWQKDGTLYRGILLEEQYSQSLLGNAFGEEEWITGVMQVVFSYPADCQNAYETSEYSYYVVENGEE